MYSILNNNNRKLLDELNWNSGGPDKMSCDCRKKRNAPWAIDETRRMSYSKRAFPPWNINIG